MKRNGFTLIELLAVIVILAIIALIATPIILGIINDAREKANERSVELYAIAVRNGIAAYQLREGKEVPADSYTSETLPFDVEHDGDIECDTIELYENGGVYVADCTVNDITVDYAYGTKQVFKGKISSVCNPISVQVEGTYTAGDEYECDVDPTKEGYDQIFYILATPAEAATSVNLIMDSNIRTGGEAVKEATPTKEQLGLVAWITKEDYEREDVGGTAWVDWSDNNAFGPITAIEYLQEATKNWKNVNPQTVSTFTDNKENTHNIAKTYTVNARLPYLSEVGATGCDILDYGTATCPLWMTNYLSATSRYPSRTGV